jgi:uncharacterized membrane protein YphA (DoxX/SURF4 family)
MMKALPERSLSIMAQFILGLVFLYSGLLKISRQEEFLLLIKSSGLSSSLAEGILLRALPWLEFAIGSMLVLGLYVEKVAGLAVILLVSCAIAIGITATKGIVLNSGRFSLNLEVGNKMSAVWGIIREIGLALIGLYVIRGRKAHF